MGNRVGRQATHLIYAGCCGFTLIEAGCPRRPIRCFCFLCSVIWKIETCTWLDISTSCTSDHRMSYCCYIVVKVYSESHLQQKSTILFDASKTIKRKTATPPPPSWENPERKFGSLAWSAHWLLMTASKLRGGMERLGHGKCKGKSPLSPHRAQLGDMGKLSNKKFKQINACMVVVLNLTLESLLYMWQHFVCSSSLGRMFSSAKWQPHHFGWHCYLLFSRILQKGIGMDSILSLPADATHS